MLSNKGIKIISDGTNLGTKIIDLDTNKEIPNIVSIRLDINVGSPHIATIELIVNQLDVIVPGSFHKIETYENTERHD